MSIGEDPGTEAQDPQLTEVILSRLSDVPTLMRRYHDLRSVEAAEHSRAAADRARALGELVWAHAASSWNAGAGNALTWLQVARTGLQPVSGHYTLARAALEGAVTCRWLIDPVVASTTRRERAARLQAEDHDQRRKWEDAWMAAHGITTRPAAFNADVRLDQHLDDMRKACLGQGKTLSIADRMDKYAGETWSWRSMSAFAHGMPWAIILSSVHETEAVPGLANVRNARVTSNSTLTAVFAIKMIGVLAQALEELNAYLVQTHEEPADNREISRG